MKKLLIVLLMLPSMAFALTCEDHAEIASGAMSYAQIEKPFLDAYKTTEGMTKKQRDFVKGILLDAYRTKPGKTQEDKARIIQSFKNKYAMECVANE